MWSYYGRKSKFINLYPKPKHNIIIEPFAGTAVYSLHEENWKNDVILIEKIRCNNSNMALFATSQGTGHLKLA